MPYRELLFDLAKEQALKWEEKKANLLEKGFNTIEVDEFGGDNIENLKTLEKEEQLKAADIDTTELDIHYSYKINKKDFEALCQFLVTLHCLVAGWIADIYYLTHALDVPPILPKLLPDLLKDIPEQQVAQEIISKVVSGYCDIDEALKKTRPNSVSDLTLNLAQALTELPDKSWAREQINNSILAWLELRGVSVSETNSFLEMMKSVLKVEDQESVANLRKCLVTLGDDAGVAQVDAAWIWMEKLNRKTEEAEHKLKLKLEEQRQQQEIERHLRLQEEQRQRQQEEAEHKLRLEEERRQEESKGTEFHFDIITVNHYGHETNCRRGSARQKVENLGDGFSLEMVYISEGTFLMGSDYGEHINNDERPQYRVSVQPFFMGKYPITQAQWKAVSKLPKVQIYINPNLSRFKDDNRPVENLKWYDAIEFCARLSQRTGKKYHLPSEAQWEYACRAGTTTPFYFGETITTELPNDDGNNFTYASEKKGVYRQETTLIGQFSSNAFGLDDMYGNVMEWCLDDWHENYEGVPKDGSVWDEHHKSKKSKDFYQDILNNGHVSEVWLAFKLPL